MMMMMMMMMMTDDGKADNWRDDMLYDASYNSL
jgi:hypothetical protein